MYQNFIEIFKLDNNPSMGIILDKAGRKKSSKETYHGNTEWEYMITDKGM